MLLLKINTMIDKKYKIPYWGKYHKGVTDCPHCGNRPETVYEHCVGFCEHSIGTLMVIECPKCFEKWSFHARVNAKISHYKYFIEFVDNGMNKHYK